MRRLIATASIVALSLTAATSATGATEARCGAGSVKGIAWVTGGAQGLGSLTSAWTNASGLFGYRWNCSGGAVSVRKPDTEPAGFDVRFAGNPGRVALANTAGGPAAASVSRNADGSFHVSMAGNIAGAGGFGSRADLAFVIIVF
jgi:hypothetical protein